MQHWRRLLVTRVRKPFFLLTPLSLLVISCSADVSDNDGAKDNTYHYVPLECPIGNPPDEVFREHFYAALDALPSGDLCDLKRLELRGLGIKSVYGLRYAMYLEYLDIGDNNIEELSDISTLRYLNTLIFDNNELTYEMINADLHSFGGFGNDFDFMLESVETLDLSDNLLDSVAMFRSSTDNEALSYLDISNNLIKDVSILVDSDFRGPFTLILTGNPLYDSAVTEQIPALEDKGVTVVY